ncbi:hypothetical protein INR49_019276 [Caranx melampygus]|nr:hypothetical protein INR49_019276 [Caranx melampygus]
MYHETTSSNRPDLLFNPSPLLNSVSASQFSPPPPPPPPPGLSLHMRQSSNIESNMEERMPRGESRPGLSEVEEEEEESHPAHLENASKTQSNTSSAFGKLQTITRQRDLLLELQVFSVPVRRGSGPNRRDHSSHSMLISFICQMLKEEILKGQMHKFTAACMTLLQLTYLSKSRQTV